MPSYLQIFVWKVFQGLICAVAISRQVLNACVQRKKWEGAFWVLQQLSQQGQQPSSTTYGLVMEVMPESCASGIVASF